MTINQFIAGVGQKVQILKDFNEVKTIKLEQNYRSSKNILACANSVIRNNPDRLGKELWSQKDEGEQVKVYRAFNERDEASFIVGIIKRWLEEGGSLSDTAIIYRSNAQSRILEDAILNSELPYRIYGGVRFYERMEIKNALAYAKLAINKNNDSQFERVINTPTRGIGVKTMDQIREHAKKDNISLWQASEQIIANKETKAAQNISNFFEVIKKLEEMNFNENLDMFFENVISLSGLKEFHGKESGEKGRSRV